MAASTCRRIGILRKTRSVLRDNSIVSYCFLLFILPVLEYCYPVWMSAAVSHLSLLDRVVRSVFRHRRKVAALSLFYRIRGFAGHSVGQLFLQLFTSGRRTRHILAMQPPSLLCVLDVAPRRTCVRLFLLVFRYGICFMSRTLRAMFWKPSRQQWIESLLG